MSDSDRRTHGFIALLALISATTLHAAEPRWNLAAAFDANSFDGHAGSIPPAVYDYSGSPRGGRLEAAVRVYGPIWVEAGWRDYGTYEGPAALCSGIPPAACEQSHYEQDAAGRTVALRGELPLGEKLHAFLRYGRAWVDIDRRYDATASFAESRFQTEDSGSMLGAGVALRLAPSWSMTLALERFDGMDQSTNRLTDTVSIGVRFDP
jgi:hypothetical protein